MKHTRTTNGGIITYDSADWVAGLGAQGQFTNIGTVKQTDAQGWQNLNNIDPFRNYGTIQPGMSPGGTTGSSALLGEIKAMQFDNNKFFFGISSGFNSLAGTTQALISQVDFSVNPTVVTTGTISGVVWPHLINDSHTGTIGYDCLLYTHNIGGTALTNQKKSLFYTYSDTTDWNVGALLDIVSSSGTFDDDFMSTVPATPLASPYLAQGVSRLHPLCIGADKVLYIGSGNILHAYDGNTGANGTFYPAVLTFAPGFEIIAIRKYNNTLLIAGNYSNSGTGNDGTGEAFVYVWNYLDLNTNQEIPLEDPYVSALFIYRGSPTVVTSGISERNGKNKIKVITGISTTKIADFDGTIPTNRGVLPSDDVLYMNCGGKILTYGDKFNKSNAINHIATNSSVGASGFVAFNNTLNQLLSSSANLSGSIIPSIDNFLVSGWVISSAKGDFYQPTLLIGKKGRIKSVEINYFSGLTASANNGGITIDLFTDYQTSNTRVVENLKTIIAPFTKRYLYDTSNNPLPSFTSIAPSFTWTGSTTGGVPIISSMAIEYEDIALQSNTII